MGAFFDEENSFEKGVLAAVNLDENTDTTADIYEECVASLYVIEHIPERGAKLLFGGKFIMTVAKGLYTKGKQFSNGQQKPDRSGQNRLQINVTNT
jgi:ADP-ribosylglycohydrolase